MRAAPLAPEIQRRKWLRSKLATYLRAHPHEWLTMADLAKVAGVGGWRTRLSECSRAGMHIEWNQQNGAASCHRHLPYVPLGRSAETVVDAAAPLPLFPEAHTGAWQR